MGDYDFVKDTIEDIGAELIFWRVNQKPGKPLAFFKYMAATGDGTPDFIWPISWFDGAIVATYGHASGNILSII